MARKKADTEFAAITTKAAKCEAIAAAKNAADLDAMWAAWEAQGWSREGQMFARVLARKAELGASLSQKEQDHVEAAARREKAGSDLPPIGAHLKR